MHFKVLRYEKNAKIESNHILHLTDAKLIYYLIRNNNSFVFRRSITF